MTPSGSANEGTPSRRSRTEGAVLGAAIGDALGHATEFLPHAAILQAFPPAGVMGFEKWDESGSFAQYTDDTQLAEVVLRGLLAGLPNGDLESTMAGIAAGIARWAVAPQGGHKAPGNACLRGAAKLAQGVHWSVAGGADDGGCGSVMRAYPFGILLCDEPEQAEQWAVEHSKMTHRAPIALAACAAMATGVAAEMRGEPRERVLAGMVEAAGRFDTGTARMAADALDDAARGSSPEEVLLRLQGWAAHEAIAAAMYVVARHPDDPRAALLEGANADGDSDSIATLAGALLGARLGIDALPGEWVRDVERSTELLALAREAADLM